MPSVKTRALNREVETLGRIPQCILGQQLPLSGAGECPPQGSPSLNRAPGAPASLLTWALQAPSPWALWPTRGFAPAWGSQPPGCWEGWGWAILPLYQGEKPSIPLRMTQARRMVLVLVFVLSCLPPHPCLSLCFHFWDPRVGSRDGQWDLKSHGGGILKNTESFCWNLRILRFFNLESWHLLPRER